jgi:hypothetical protein
MSLPAPNSKVYVPTGKFARNIPQICPCVLFLVEQDRLLFLTADEDKSDDGNGLISDPVDPAALDHL